MADQTLLQYLASQTGDTGRTGAASLMMAAARDAQNRRLGGDYLTQEQQLAGKQQGLGPLDLHKVKYRDRKWVNLDDSAYRNSTAGQFNYGIYGPQFANYGKANPVNARTSQMKPLYVREPGNESGMGIIPENSNTAPPTAVRQPGDPINRTPGTVTGSTPFTGTRTIPTGTAPPPPPPPPPVADPNAAPPRNPVTTAPGPYQQPTGAMQAGWTPGPMRSFDPSQMLLALRQATNGGQQGGTNNAVQNNLGTWMANSMRARGGG